MKRATPWFGLVLLGSMLFWGCESPFSIDEFEDKSLAISGYVTPSPPLPGFLVFVSPVHYFDGSESQSLLSEASVRIYQGNQLVTTLLPGTLQGRNAFYRGGYTPLEGVPYRLEVSAEGYNTVQAVDRLPAKVPARWLGRDNLQITANPDGSESYILDVSFEINDPVIVHNYYHIFVEAWIRDTMGGDAFVLANLEQIGPRDPAIKPYIFNHSILLDGEGFIGQSKQIALECRFEVPPHFELSHLMLDMRHVSQHYYHFHRSHIDQLTTGTNPIVEPTLLVSNVSNGFGFFAGYQSTRDTMLFQ